MLRSDEEICSDFECMDCDTHPSLCSKIADAKEGETGETYSLQELESILEQDDED